MAADLDGTRQLRQSMSSFGVVSHLTGEEWLFYNLID